MFDVWTIFYVIFLCLVTCHFSVVAVTKHHDIHFVNHKISSVVANAEMNK